MCTFCWFLNFKGLNIKKVSCLLFVFPQNMGAQTYRHEYWSLKNMDILSRHITKGLMHIHLFAIFDVDTGRCHLLNLHAVDGVYFIRLLLF